MPTPVRGAHTTMSTMIARGAGSGGVTDASGDKTGAVPHEGEGGDECGDRIEIQRQYIREFFHKEDSPYSHKIYKQAAELFEVLKHDFDEDDFAQLRARTAAKRNNAPVPAPQIPQIEFESTHEKRLTLSLVFNTLKYQKFLEEMLDECVFFRVYSEYKDDSSLVMVILCDFQQRKFQRRTPQPGEALETFILEIEEALFTCRTKLNAGLARSRIKARVLSVDHLLPDSVRHNDSIGSSMHLSCWVNQIKIDILTVFDTLRSMGFSRVYSEAKLAGKTYMVDLQCGDLLTFPHEHLHFIEEHELVQEGKLVLQDKSSCVGAQSIRYLINEGDDILQVNPGSGLTIAHLVSLTHGTESVIHVFGVMTQEQEIKVNETLERLGAKSRVKLYNESLQQVEHTDERLRHIKVVLVGVEDSRSAVANPVNFICSENEDITILKNLSMGSNKADGRVSELVVKHNTMLKHVLRFPRVQGVVYYTRSREELENEGVVVRAIEYVNTIQQKRTPFRICPPVVPLSDFEIEHENPLNGKYLRYAPSQLMAGCFVATITREADDPKEAAKDILARAAARGILTGVPVSVEDNKKSHKKTSKGKKGKRSAKRVSSPRRSKSNKEGVVISSTGGGGTPGAVSKSALRHSSKKHSSRMSHASAPLLTPPNNLTASPTLNNAFISTQAASLTSSPEVLQRGNSSLPEASVKAIYVGKHTLPYGQFPSTSGSYNHVTGNTSGNLPASANTLRAKNGYRSPNNKFNHSSSALSGSPSERKSFALRERSPPPHRQVIQHPAPFRKKEINEIHDLQTKET